MRGTLLLQLAALSTAFVIPDEQVFNLEHVPVESHAPSVFDKLPSKSEVLSEIENTFDNVRDEISNVFDRVSNKAENEYEEISRSSKHHLDEALAYVQEVSQEANSRIHETYFNAQGWLDSALSEEIDMDNFDLFEHFKSEDDHDHPEPPHHGPPGRGPRPPHHGDDHDHPPHHGDHDHPPHHGDGDHDHPPHHGDGDHDHPPHHGDGDHDHPPHHGPPHHGPPHRPGHGHKSNMTVYQLISSSNYTTKLAKWINEYDDIVDALNGTKANFTIFAPTDRAFEKIPEDAPKPSKEVLKKILSYHISPKFYPAGRILVTRTIPTLLTSEELGDKPLPQRLSTNIGPRGLTVNFYSRIVAVDIFGSNGVIHGVDSIILPPPEILKIISLVPSELSTLELGLTKTGLIDELNQTHAGGTFFAPSNFAFQKLGPRINAFLFSPYGQKYLKALLKYHVVREGNTLYSDAYYKPGADDERIFKCSHAHEKRDGEHHGPPGRHHGPPKGFFQVELPTLLEEKSLNIDIARYGRLIDIRINGFSHVVVSDGVAKDGVIHLVSDVLIPPKRLGESVKADEELTVDELKERLEPLVEKEQKGWFDL